MKKLLLVDSSSLAVSVFYAMGGAKYLEADTVPLEEVEGFVSDVVAATLDNVTRRVKLDGFSSVRMALEAPPWAPCWRYDRYKEYKHNSYRGEKPHVAAALQQPLIDGAAHREIPTVFAPGMEADDVIATMVELARDWVAEGNEVHIWSMDKDLHQLVTHERIKIIGKAGEITTKEDVEKYWGLPAEAVPALKALVGDKSDNIPGVRGMGLQTAQKILRYAPYRKPTPYCIDFSKVPERFSLALRNRAAQLARDEHLCTLQRDIPKLYSGEHYNRKGNIYGEEERQREGHHLAGRLQEAL